MNLVISDERGARASRFFTSIIALVLPLVAMIYALNIPSRLGWMFYLEQYLILFSTLCCAFIFASGMNQSHLWFNRAVDGTLRLLFTLASIGLGVYATIHYESILFSIGFITPDKVFMATLGTILLLEALRRVTGYALLVLCIVAILGPAVLSWISDGAWIRPIRLDRLTTLIFFGQGGIHGLPLQVAATVVAVFVIFGKCLIESGGGDAIQTLARRLVGQSQGGDKIAITASGLFGSLSGSASANVATTGVMTIPLMVSQGIPPFRAAAIEAVASTGGLILPPIMAATGFLIAEYLTIPYADVAAAALVPALLFYASVLVYCHFANRNSAGSATDESPVSSDSITRIVIPFLGPIALLIIFLFVLYQSASASAIAAAVGALLIGLWNGKTRHWRVWVRVLHDSTPQIVEIAVICACAGIIMGVLGATGVGASLSRVILSLADGSLPILILISAVACIVLGMGVPVTATYVILIGLIAPALVGFGIPDLAAHLFVFYFGTLSFLTPPVCLSVFVAANLARSKMTQTALEALKIALPAYLLPVVFLYQPALIGLGTWAEILGFTTATATGLLLVAYGIGSQSNKAMTSRSHLWSRMAIPLGSAVLLGVLSL
ncbi:MAG: TRAP transporter fused permease subunit [Gammaproteobacteria bacterium]|nr:TRAP transporter fused permease subunit [Gammaproteobacteria bacterium]